MTLSSDWVERNLYDSEGHSNSTYYIRIIRRKDSYIWDPINQEIVAVDAITWEDSTTLLVEQGETGVFPVVVDKDIPAGTYDIIAYKQLGSAPANTDDVEKEWETKLGGDIFGF